MTPILSQSEFNDGLLDFLRASPTAFHATENIVNSLTAAGFTRLHEADAWQLVPGKRYFCVRNDSSVIAFVFGKKDLLETGIRFVGAHTDSPCLKVKPQPELVRKNYLQLGVEVYGGALLAPWFDRDLSLAGRVTYVTPQNTIASALINFKTPIATIPSLAIHLDREVNNSRSINPQKDIVPVLMQLPPEKSFNPSFKALLLTQLKHQIPATDAAKILNYEMSFYDTQPPTLIGYQQEFIASARLDNLLSCYTGMQAILCSDPEVSSLLICTDHEEVGSTSCCGANGPMLQQFLERLLPDGETLARVIERSLMISADNAHGVHPNFMDKHDENHGPLLNQGPVIKINNNQRYATTSETGAFFQWISEKAQVPVQTFVTRTDLACGSTIGPIVAANIGVKTIDVGVPTFAMHSIRELAGVADAHYLYRALIEFYSHPSSLVF